MSSFWKGVLATVTAGLILVAVTPILEFSFAPRAEVKWGTFGQFHRPNANDRQYIAGYGFSLRLENIGNKSSDEIEVLLARTPNYLESDPPLTIARQNTPSGHLLTIDRLGPADAIILEIGGMSRLDVEYVREAGQFLDKSYIAQPEFERQFGITVPFFLFIILISLAGSAVIGFFSQLFLDSKDAEEEPLATSSDKSIVSEAATSQVPEIEDTTDVK